MASEKNFENAIKKWCSSHGIWHVKFFANRNTKKGIPDLLLCCNSRFVALEVKGEGGHPSDLQLWNCKKIAESNGIGLIVWPEDFAILKELLTRILERSDADVSDLILSGKYLH